MPARSDYGLQVDAWGAFIPGRADLGRPLVERVVETVRQRGLENLTIGTAPLKVSDPMGGSQERDHIIFDQTLSGGGSATLALRIGQRGAGDLELSWRLFERNVGKEVLWGMGQSGMIILGIILIGAGVLTAPIGGACILVPIGIALIGAGIGWWGLGRRQTSASTYQQFDSRILAQTVDYCLMSVLAQLGVSADELRVLHQAQMQGLGQLGGTRPPVLP